MTRYDTAYPVRWNVARLYLSDDTPEAFRIGALITRLSTLTKYRFVTSPLAGDIAPMV